MFEEESGLLEQVAADLQRLRSEIAALTQAYDQLQCDVQSLVDSVWDPKGGDGLAANVNDLIRQFAQQEKRLKDLEDCFQEHWHGTDDMVRYPLR